MPYDQNTDLECFETFNPGFSSPAHDLSPITTRAEFAIEQLQNAIDQAIFWLGLAESWAEEYGTGNEGQWDLNIAKINAECAQISAFMRDKK